MVTPLPPALVTPLTDPTHKVLLVMSASGTRSRLESAFQAAGYATESVEEGLFALTEFERNRPDAVVSAGALADMSGQELFEMLREDSSLEQMGFVLLSGSNAQMLGRGHDIQIPEHTAAEDTVSFVAGLLDKRSRKPSGPPASPVVQTQRGQTRKTVPTGARNTEFGGTLEHFSLFDLLMLLTQTGKTGELRVLLRDREARILLERGQLCHAEYRGERGEGVLLSIFLDAEHSDSSEFAFDTFQEEQLPPELSRQRNVHTPTDQLLLNVAIALDQVKQSGHA